MVGNCQREQRPAGLYRRLQQRGVESEQVRAVARRAFREYGDVNAGVEQGVDFAIHQARVAATAATQEDGVVALGEPADERPGADFRLRNEGCGAHAINGENVEPRDMIGDHEAAGRRVVRLRLDVNGEDREELPRPALF